MTDQTPPPPQEPPYSAPADNPYASAGSNPYAPAYSSASGPKPKQGLSLTSFILGLAGFVFSWIPFLGLIVAIGAVVLGFLAMSKEKGAPKWMWIIGLVAGFLALLGGLVWTIITIAVIANAGNYNTY